MTMAESLTWQKLLLKDRPLIFGVLNCTPDSFSDGGQYLKEKAIFEKLELLVSNGADVIDIGAESTRPGAKEISYEDQMKRLRPAFKYLENISTSYNGNFSIDTRNSNVAKECLSSGINIINDVSGGNHDEKMFEVISNSKSLCVLMHMRGNPKIMQTLTKYENIVDDVCEELNVTIDYAIKAGIHESKIMVDPGIGFAKTPQDCINIIKNIDVIKNRLGFSVLVGLCRKSFISKYIISIRNMDESDMVEWATHYMSIYLYEHGVDALRVHEPGFTINAIRFAKNFSDKW